MSAQELSTTLQDTAQLSRCFSALHFHSASRKHYKYTRVINGMNSHHQQITEFNSQFGVNY